MGRHRPRSSARTLAAYLARAEGGISIARMARFFGREESTLVRAVLRLEQDLTTNGESQRQVARLSKAIRSIQYTDGRRPAQGCGARRLKY